eukprot:732998_1
MNNKINLRDVIEFVNILNVNTEESPIDSFSDVVCNANANADSYIVSDCDEELLFLIQFKQNVNLKSMKIYALPPTESDNEMSPPKQIRIYHTDDLNIDFDGLRMMSADKSVVCANERLKKGQRINLQTKSKNTVKFRTTTYLVVYIESNQEKTDKTFVNLISFEGKYDKNNDRKLIFPNDPAKSAINSAAQISSYINTQFRTQLNAKTAPKSNADCSNPTSIDQCDGNVKNCAQLPAFVARMNECHDTNINGTKVKEAMDHYHHLIYQHNSDGEYEFMHRYISDHCERCQSVRECDKIRRTYRDRSVFLNDNESSDAIDEQDEKRCLTDAVYLEIMDTMHCHFYHCFDLGYRMHSKNRITEHKSASGHTDDVGPQERAILTHNASTSNSSNSLPSININRQHNQIFVTNPFVEKEEMYSYGFRFAYRGRGHKDDVSVTSKYDDLKEEVTQNSICHLTMAQFKHVSKKAAIHLRSRHHKTFYRNHFPFKHKDIIIFMIYCNFTAFSYEFSKTYRENYGRNHNEFYWMGFGLREALQWHYNPIKEGKMFYHGVNCRKLMFPYKNKGINIFCPLSTSSSLQVALQFTNKNNGLIVEFEAAGPHTVCFSTAWLSRYPSEREYLFMNLPNWGDLDKECLCIWNIRDPCDGFQYRIVLQTERYMDSVLFDVDIASDHTMITEEIRMLIRQIVSERSSISMTVTPYADAMLTEYFNNKVTVKVSIESVHQMKWKNCEPLFDLLYHDTRIDLSLIFSLFPNMEKMVVMFDNWNRAICDNLIKDTMELCKASRLKIKEIWFGSVDSSGNCVQFLSNIVDEYTVPLRKQSLFIVVKENVTFDVDDGSRIKIKQIATIDPNYAHKALTYQSQFNGVLVGLLAYQDETFVRYVIRERKKIHFKDVDDQIVNLMAERIDAKRQHLHTFDTNEILWNGLAVIHQSAFNFLCKGLCTLHVYPNSLLLKLMLHRETSERNGRINFGDILELFVHLDTVAVVDIVLDEFVFDDILQALKKSSTACLAEIVLISKRDHKYNYIAGLIWKYRVPYNEMGFRMDTDNIKCVRMQRYHVGLRRATGKNMHIVGCETTLYFKD